MDRSSTWAHERNGRHASASAPRSASPYEALDARGEAGLGQGEHIRRTGAAQDDPLCGELADARQRSDQLIDGVLCSGRAEADAVEQIGVQRGLGDGAQPGALDGGQAVDGAQPVQRRGTGERPADVAVDVHGRAEVGGDRLAHHRGLSHRRAMGEQQPAGALVRRDEVDRPEAGLLTQQPADHRVALADRRPRRGVDVEREDPDDLLDGPALVGDVAVQLDGHGAVDRPDAGADGRERLTVGDEGEVDVLAGAADAQLRGRAGEAL